MEHEAKNPRSFARMDGGGGGVAAGPGRSPPSVVDLFCGIGALSYGFAMVGFGVAAGIDSDEACRYAYEFNTRARFVCKPVETVTAGEVAGLHVGDGPRVLIGCAPCQPFSAYSNRKKGRANTSSSSDGRQPLLLDEFARLVRETRPHAVAMENVPRLRRHAVFKRFVECLAGEGYNVWRGAVRCSDYGVPQTRRRLVLLASRLGHIGMVGRTHAGSGPPTVRDAIGGLEPVRAGCSSPSDPLHVASRLSETNLERMSQTRPGGGGWKGWERRLVPPMRRKRSGRTYGSVYGRMSWDRPAPTITTQFTTWGTGRFGHPEQDRALTLREGALIQTFPPNYKFVDGRSAVRIVALARQIGNAVPVALGAAIAESVRRHLDGRDGGNAGGRRRAAARGLLAAGEEAAARRPIEENGRL